MSALALLYAMGASRVFYIMGEGSSSMYTEGLKLGKFEGCESELVGLILHGVCGISGYDESCGDVSENGRWYALVHGKRYSFIVTECDQGFVDYDMYDSKAEAVADWALIESTTYLNELEV